MGFIVRRVGAWARLPTMAPDDAATLLRRDGRVLGGVTAVLMAGGVLVCLGGLASGLLPSSWAQGFLWGAIVMLSDPEEEFEELIEVYRYYCRKSSISQRRIDVNGRARGNPAGRLQTARW